MFSRRIPSDLDEQPLARALTRARAAGRDLLDLTVSNPTRVGLEVPPDLLEPLGAPEGLAYHPDALGLAAAREAVAGELARRGLAVPADHIALTASTSEAYSLLFKLLADPGDEVLLPRPSYPLLEHLARLDGLAPVPYPLAYAGGWLLDRAALEAAVTPRTRALVVVTPNNPTGSRLSRPERAFVDALAARRGLAVISDEVFADYPLEPSPEAVASMLGGQGWSPTSLCFALGGLSKSIGMPQLKLGWIAAGGPGALVDQALARLDFVADQYLSAGTPVQRAAPRLLARGAQVRAAIQRRLVANLACLRAVVADHPACTLLPVEAGWAAVLRIPALRPEAELAMELLERDGVVVHPGYYFDMPHEGFLVLSLLVAPEILAAGAPRVCARAYS